ncbi:tetratricopeptide repeat protein [uncultured Psychrobacter sp.]|uniref:tetratricopeptide repeat protein n=1 Tax=uncultured Psychrobacter sp. TaxID=259303 RepID=UPI00261D1263|nr:tetratricopeptide repeat protein [uncultured Psychrobacter sp.]
MNEPIVTEETKIQWEPTEASVNACIGAILKNGIEGISDSDISVVKYDYKKMFELFTKAAEQGHADAQNNLGLMYKEGLAIPQSDYEAFKWFTEAAERGHADAQNNLGLIYRDGKETPQVVYMILHDHEINETELSPKDYEELFKDFGLDNPKSFDYLDVAKALSEIKGIDHDKAIEWFTKAAANGSDAAKINLKNMSDT